MHTACTLLKTTDFPTCLAQCVGLALQGDSFLPTPHQDSANGSPLPSGLESVMVMGRLRAEEILSRDTGSIFLGTGRQGRNQDPGSCTLRAGPMLVRAGLWFPPA